MQIFCNVFVAFTDKPAFICCNYSFLSLIGDSTMTKEGRMLIDNGHKCQAYQSKQQRTSQSLNLLESNRSGPSHLSHQIMKHYPQRSDIDHKHKTTRYMFFSQAAPTFQTF